MMSQHSNLATASYGGRNENLERLCTTMATVSMAKGCTQTMTTLDHLGGWGRPETHGHFSR